MMTVDGSCNNNSDGDFDDNNDKNDKNDQQTYKYFVCFSKKNTNFRDYYLLKNGPRNSGMGTG